MHIWTYENIRPYIPHYTSLQHITLHFPIPHYTTSHLSTPPYTTSAHVLHHWMGLERLLRHGKRHRNPAKLGWRGTDDSCVYSAGVRRCVECVFVRERKRVRLYLCESSFELGSVCVLLWGSTTVACNCHAGECKRIACE
jgi:hypothetical protein